MKFRPLRSRVSAVTIGAVILMTGVGVPAAYAATRGDSLTQNSVDNTEIQNNSLISADVQDGALTGVDIADNTIGTLDINDGTIIANDIATNGVGSAEIADGAVTAADLRPDVTDYIASRVADRNGHLAGSHSTTENAGNGASLGSFGVEGSQHLLTATVSFGADVDAPVRVQIRNSSGAVVGQCATNVVAGGFAETCSLSSIAATSGNYFISMETPSDAVFSVSVDAAAVVVG